MIHFIINLYIVLESSFKPNTRISPLVERRPIVSNIDTKSKNVNAASVARNTAVLPQVNSHRPETSTTVAGVEEGKIIANIYYLPFSVISVLTHVLVATNTYTFVKI